jgi:hypothetical protein
MIYYAFTSLSTVGFGDYVPRSDSERLFISMVLLFGVLTFSYVMGNFIQIIDSLKKQNATFDDGDNLSKFFGLLHNFNQGNSIRHDLKREMEEHFDYKWNNDMNIAIQSEADIAIL